jgi:apolipoprotein N-acyltransferase
MYFSDRGEVISRGKNMLVPFAEYVPFSMTFPVLTSLAVPAGGVTGYIPEEIPSVFNLGNLSFGLMICFESVFPGYARTLALAGSRFLVVITQDGWWRSTTQYEQHFYFSRLRALETGLTVIQVSVDGISGVIAPDGSIEFETRPRTSDVRFTDVPLMNSSTFYVRFGNALRSLILAVWLAAVGASMFFFRRLQPTGHASKVGHVGQSGQAP